MIQNYLSELFLEKWNWFYSLLLGIFLVVAGNPKVIQGIYGNTEFVGNLLILLILVFLGIMNFRVYRNFALGKFAPWLSSRNTKFVQYNLKGNQRIVPKNIKMETDICVVSTGKEGKINGWGIDYKSSRIPAPFSSSSELTQISQSPGNIDALQLIERRMEITIGVDERDRDRFFAKLRKLELDNIPYRIVINYTSDAD